MVSHMPGLPVVSAIPAAYAAPPPGPPTFAVPAQLQGRPAEDDHAESLTRGLPDPTSIAEQKAEYNKSLEQQLSHGNDSPRAQNDERKKLLHEAAERQKQAFMLQVEQQVKAQELFYDKQTNQAMMGLKKAALDQKAALEQQAASLTLEYQQRKMQEEFVTTQVEMRRQYMES